MNNLSIYKSQRIVMKLRRSGCQHPAIGLHGQFVAIPVGDTASRALHHRHEGHVVVRLKTRFKDDIAVTRCKQPIDITVASEAPQFRSTRQPSERLGIPSRNKSGEVV